MFGWSLKLSLTLKIIFVKDYSKPPYKIWIFVIFQTSTEFRWEKPHYVGHSSSIVKDYQLRPSVTLFATPPCKMSIFVIFFQKKQLRAWSLKLSLTFKHLLCEGLPTVPV